MDCHWNSHLRLQPQNVYHVTDHVKNRLKEYQKSTRAATAASLVFHATAKNGDVAQSSPEKGSGHNL